MKKISKKVLAIILSVLMVATTAPISVLSVLGATDSGVDTSALSDAIDAYRAAMDGSTFYTDYMTEAYQEYIESAALLDKALYGTVTVTQTEITNQATALTTATNTMKGYTYSVPHGTAKPTSSNPGFSDDGVNLSSVTCSSVTLHNSGANDAGVLPTTSSASLLAEAYNLGYQNLLWVQTGKSDANYLVGSTSTYWLSLSNLTSGSSSNLDVAFYIPDAVILYTGDETVNGVTTPFAAHIASMMHYNRGNNKSRRVAAMYVNDNDYFNFGMQWAQARKQGTTWSFGTKYDDDYQDAIASKYTARYNSKDYVNALAAASATDKASNTDTAYTHGSRTTSANGAFYMASYLNFAIPSTDSVYSTNYYREYTSLNLGVIGGAEENSACSCSDGASGDIQVKIGVVNYKLLRDALTAAAPRLQITAANPYYEGGLASLIAAVEDGASYTPSYSKTSYDSSTIQSLGNTIKAKTEAITGATVTADSQPYTSLESETAAAIKTRGSTEGGKYWLAVNESADYTTESLTSVISATYYAQKAFDVLYDSSEKNFNDSFTIAGTTMYVGEDDPETDEDDRTLITIEGIENKDVTWIRNNLRNATLAASANKVDTTNLILYIEELEEVLEYNYVFSLDGGTSVISNNQANNITNYIDNTVKYNVWGTTPYYDETGTTKLGEFSNYPNPAKALRATTANNNKVAQYEAALLAYLNQVGIYDRGEILSDDGTYRTSLYNIRYSLTDSTQYNPGDYYNGTSLAAASAFVGNNYGASSDSARYNLFKITSKHAKAGDYANINTATLTVYDGIVDDKIQEYKDWIQYCKDTIDNLVNGFLTIPNGTILNTGTMKKYTFGQSEKTFEVTGFNTYTDVVILRTDRRANTVDVGPGTIKFYQGDTLSWGEDYAYDHQDTLDVFDMNDTVQTNTTIHKKNGFDNAEWEALDEADYTTYAGTHSVSTTNGGTYSLINIKGVEGGASSANGESTLYGIDANGGEVTDTQTVITGLDTVEGNGNGGIKAGQSSTTTASGRMVLSLPAGTDVSNVTYSTYPAVTTYTASGRFGAFVRWIADGAGATVFGYSLKNGYTGYDHVTATQDYTHNFYVLDVSTLKALVDTANALNSTDYTDDTWAALQTALEEANSPYFGTSGGVNLTYREVSYTTLASYLKTRYQNLYKAYKGLRLRGNNAVLAATNTNYNGTLGVAYENSSNQYYSRYANDELEYTTATWNEYKAAFEAGVAAIDAVDDGAGNITYGKYYSDPANNYSLPDYEYYNSKTEVIGTENGTNVTITVDDTSSLSTEQAEINALAQAIKDKYAALRKAANVSVLTGASGVLKSNSQYATRRATNNSSNTYTTGSWAKFADAFDAADVAANSASGKYYTELANYAVREYPYYAAGSEGDESALSTEQTEINALAEKVKTTYNGLVGWADFTPLDTAYTNLKNALQATNGRKIYTVDQLNAINTMFSGLTTSYYKLANDTTKQLKTTKDADGYDMQDYDANDNAAIAAEAAAITAAIPTASGIDAYTAESVIKRVNEASGDPDDWSTADALAAAEDFEDGIYSTVTINDAYEINGTYTGFNKTQAELETKTTQILSLIHQYEYTVKVVDVNGNYVYADKYHGTEPIGSAESATTYHYGDTITLDNNNNVFTYNYESATVKGHEESVIIPDGDTYEFVVLGDTTIVVGDRGGATASTDTLYKISFIDNIDHVYDIEYVSKDASLDYNASTGEVVINNYDGSGAQKTVNAPKYAFYDFTGLTVGGNITADGDIEGAVVVTASYEATESDASICTVSIAIAGDDATDPETYAEIEVYYNDKITLDPEILKRVKSKDNAANSGRIYVNDEEESSLTQGFGFKYGSDPTIYGFTMVHGAANVETWTNGVGMGAGENLETLAYIGDEYTFYASDNIAIVVYETEDDYLAAVEQNYLKLDENGNVPNVNVFADESLVVSDSKFTMHGEMYLTGGETIVECGMLMYTGAKEITEDDLNLANYNTLGAYRLKYTKSTKFNNINVSVNTENIAAGRTLNVRYRAYIKYKASDGTIKTVLSDLQSDTLSF